MDIHKNGWEDILEDARWYPSPHNSQPIRAELKNAQQAVFYYDKKCGLPAENYGIPFGFVCMGVFLEGLRVCAAARGFKLHTRLTLNEMNFNDSDIYHKFATVALVPDATIDSQRAQQELEWFKRRQTSRRPYNNQLVEPKILKAAASITKSFGYTFISTSDTTLVKEIISVNQQTLFDDLRRDPVYFELMQWLRFSKKEAKEKADGLSAQTMLMPGRVLHFAMKHRGLWELPIVGRFFKWVYLRTMKGVRQVGWITGPFKTLTDYETAGECFMRVWLFFTSQNVHLHPYGTVITNPHSHKRFVKLAKADETGSVMAWMLFRFGYSDQPPQSERRSLEKMIIKSGKVNK